MNVTAVSFHSEGKWLVTGSEDGTIRIWDLRWLASMWFTLLLLTTCQRSAQVHRTYDNSAPGNWTVMDYCDRVD